MRAGLINVILAREQRQVREPGHIRGQLRPVRPGTAAY
jgi:hypothetical protein